MLRSRVFGIALLSGVVIACASVPAQAGFTLELRPASQSIADGQAVELGLYAVGVPDQEVGVVLVVLNWDPADLTLVGNRDDGPFSWGTSYFPSGGLNTDWSDGLAYYNAFTGTCGSTATASSDGLLVTTLLFSTNGNYTVTTVSILASSGSYSTRAYDDLPIPPGCLGEEISPLTIGGAVSVIIVACSTPADCDDGDYCTFNLCSSGTCSHPPNYVDSIYCCNPANGSLTELSDGNDCTQDNCDTETGQVTHPNEDNGTACGDDTDNYCTDPDTCDGGVCVSNDAVDNTWCELDGDECTKDRCSGGVCVTIETLADDTPCSDGQDNCTPGQDTCQGGVCVGGGENPCTYNPGQPYCQDREVILDSCFDDGDCITGQEFFCEHDNGDPCTEGGADCYCRRPYACVECASSVDCPDSGNCWTYMCHPYGYCFQYVNNDWCQDGIWCNGEEWCQIEHPVGVCHDDVSPPCQDPDYPVCREETCCDGEECDDDWCECVECTSNSHCDDGDPCNGEETCDIGVTHICLPGTPIDCTHLDDDCNVGVCNSGTGLCEAEVIAEYVGWPGVCQDGDICTYLDTCTAEGDCVEYVPPLGHVDLDWDEDPPAPELTVVLGEVVDIELYAISNGERCNHDSEMLCTADEDCSYCTVGNLECTLGVQACNGGFRPGWPCTLGDNTPCYGYCTYGSVQCMSDVDCPGGEYCDSPPAGYCDDDCEGPANTCNPDICTGDTEIPTIEAVLSWEPAVLELVGQPVDPCTDSTWLCRTCAESDTNTCTWDGSPCDDDTDCPRECIGGDNHGNPCDDDEDCIAGDPPGECRDNFCKPDCRCTDHDDCLPPPLPGLGCFCPDGARPPCDPPLSGVCLTGEYDWQSSVLPLSNPLNDTLTDGDAFYWAWAQLLPAGAEAPLPAGLPLHVTTFQFTATSLSEATTLEFIDCVDHGEGTASFTRVGGGIYGTNLGNTGSITLRVVECIAAGDCEDSNLCTVDECNDNVCSNEWITNCCLDVTDCDDEADCTDDSCVDNSCVHVDTCPNHDGLFCTEDFCNVPVNACDVRDPCPSGTICQEEAGGYTCLGAVPPLPEEAYVPPTPCVANSDCAISPGDTGSVCITVGSPPDDVSTCYNPKNRYLSFDPNNFEPVAFSIVISNSMFHPGAVGMQKWVGDPECYDAFGDYLGDSTYPCDAGNDELWLAGLVDVQPAMQTWALEEIVHIGDCFISPVATYEIRTTGNDGASFSDPLVIPTIQSPAPHQWGDMISQKDMVNGWWIGPNKVVNFLDVNAAVKFFEGVDEVLPTLPMVDIHPQEPNRIVNFADIMQVVLAFEGGSYLFGNTNDPCGAP